MLDLMSRIEGISHEFIKINSFNTGDPENSGFNRMQLPSQHYLQVQEITYLKKYSNPARRFSRNLGWKLTAKSAESAATNGPTYRMDSWGAAAGAICSTEETSAQAVLAARQNQNIASAP